jgi:hypothetical protein
MLFLSRSTATAVSLLHSSCFEQIYQGVGFVLFLRTLRNIRQSFSVTALWVLLVEGRHKRFGATYWDHILAWTTSAVRMPNGWKVTNCRIDGVTILAHFIYIWELWSHLAVWLSVLLRGLWDHLTVSISVYPLLIFFSFSMQSGPYERKVEDSFFPELLVV